MNVTADQVITEAMGLPAQMRAFVAEKLIESLDAEPLEEMSPAWRKEIQKRSREVEAGTADLRNAEEVFNRAYAAVQ